MARTLAVAGMLLAMSLAGCALLEDGAAGADGQIVRIVDLDVDPEAMGAFGDVNDAADFFRAIGSTRFVYTHDRAETDAASLTASYVDEDGRAREVPLSRFTDRATLARGDQVTIPDALFTTALTIRDGDSVVAQRGGPPRDWLEVNGYPMPIATDGGLAVWDIQGDVDMDASLDRVRVRETGTDYDYVCNPSPTAPPACAEQRTPYNETYEARDLSFDAGTDLDATLRLEGVGAASAPALEVALDGLVDLEALLKVQVLHERDGAQAERSDAAHGFEVDVRALGDGTIGLRFAGGELARVGSGGSLDVDGTVDYWDADTPRGSERQSDVLDFLDASQPYREEDVPGDANPVSFIAEALSDLWRMDLAAGDEFNLRAASADTSTMPTMSMSIRVTDHEEREVPAGTFDAWRVETTQVITVPIPDRAAERFELPKLVTWIDTRSGVPIAMEQSIAYDYDEEDFASLFALAESVDEDVEVTPPTDLTIGVHGTTLTELQEWDPGLRMAPMASLLLPASSLLAPAAWMFLVPYGFGQADAYGESWAEAPDMAFVTDREGDGGVITVVRAPHNLWWGDLGVLGGECVAPDDRDVLAGDEIVCAVDGTVRITHWPSNTLLYETTL